MSALALVALLGAISAGCGSNASSETSTSTSNSTATGGGNAGSGATGNATGQAKAVKFAECVRAHGVPHFPDPNAKGEFVFGIDVTPAVWGQAVNACKSLQPPGSLSGKRTPKQQTASIRFAECVRENGVKDFPDPANGQPLIDTTRIPSSEKPGGMTILNAATHKCGRVLAEAAAGQ
ncbi:MAG: hypothetical protein ACYDHT_04020 [Solirubrobacteraceae bacterium]